MALDYVALSTPVWCEACRTENMASECLGAAESLDEATACGTPDEFSSEGNLNLISKPDCLGDGSGDEGAPVVSIPKRRENRKRAGGWSEEGLDVAKVVEEAISSRLPASLTDLDTYLTRKGFARTVCLDKDYPRISSTLLNCMKSTFCSMDWIEIMEKIPDDYFDSEPVLSRADSLEWFGKICTFNRFDQKTFFLDALSVMDRVKTKINTVLALGPPNSGKTLVMESLAKSVVYYANCQSFNGKSSFEFQDMLNSRCALINEPKITDLTIETLKNIFEGASTGIDVKYKSAQLLSRTPCFVASNMVLTAYLVANRELQDRALKARSVVYNFNQFEALADCKKKLHPLMWLDMYHLYVE